MAFFDSAFLWFDIVVAAMVAAAATAAVGTYALLRRVVFLPAALSQLSGLGVMVAFFLAHILHQGHDGSLESPRLFAVIFAAVGALLLGLLSESKDTTREWSLGAVYLVSSALILLVGGSIPQELHDVNDILFGNAIAIERNQMVFTVMISLVLLGIHLLLAKVFMAVAFDSVTLAAHGVPVRWLDALLFLTMGLATAFSTRIVGALPAFAFSVFPPAAALLIVHNIRLIIVTAALLGAISAFIGYYASFVFSLPTGACMAMSALLIYIMAQLFNLTQRQFHRRGSIRS